MLAYPLPSRRRCRIWGVTRSVAQRRHEFDGARVILEGDSLELVNSGENRLPRRYASAWRLYATALGELESPPVSSPFLMTFDNGA